VNKHKEVKLLIVLVLLFSSKERKTSSTGNLDANTRLW